jgi:hypothetical protein
LCYARDGNSKDPSLPFALKPVERIGDSNFPCYSIVAPKNERPIFRGDRLRIAINLDDPTTRLEDPITQAFFQNVSALNLDVVLTAAAPLQPALLRLNLGASTSPAGLGGNQAPEAQNYAGPDYQCFKEILGFASPPAGGAMPCSGPAGSRNNVLILPWPYTFPPDVIPYVYLSAVYTNPDNGGMWQAQRLYPAGSVIQCPGEDQCIVPSTGPGQLIGMPAGTSGTTEPKWPGPNVVSDGAALSWSALSVTYRVNDSAGSHAPDGRAVFQPGDLVVWNSGQSQIESKVETWQPGHWYVANQSVVICPPDFSFPPVDHESLCIAKSSGMSGTSPPLSWSRPLISDNGLHWTYDQGPINPHSSRWSAHAQYKIGDTIRCEQPSQQRNLCTAGVTGFSGNLEPWWPQNQPTSAPTSQSPAGSTRDNQIPWSAYTPSSTTAASAGDQLANMNGQQLPQVHGPSLWAISTALVYSTGRIPAAYSFKQTVASGCPTLASGAKAATLCPDVSTAYQRGTDIALMVSPYVFHHIYSKFTNGPDGVDAETKWSFNNLADYIPEPILGFSLNSPGSNYYGGLSLELLQRDLQVIWGWTWMKAPFLTNPVSAGGSPANTVTPNTYTGFAHSHFVGIAFNLAGLISGH